MAIGSLVHSTTQCSPDISRRHDITRAATQNLDTQNDVEFKNFHFILYNTCILPIFLYDSECWAVTKRDVLKIDTLDQWCLRKLL